MPSKATEGLGGAKVKLEDCARRILHSVLIASNSEACKTRVLEENKKAILPWKGNFQSWQRLTRLMKWQKPKHV
jgi:hypothetical protein